MIKHTETKTFAYPKKQMYELVADVESYPEFLPGWNHVVIIERKENGLIVEQGIGYSQFNWKFLSNAILEPHTHLQITSNEEPFNHLLIDWNLVQKRKGHTDVTLTMEMKMRSVILQTVVNSVISQPITQLLGVFEERAKKVYGEGNTG